MAQLRRCDDLVAHLQLEVGNHRTEVCIAAAFAYAVDGPLHMRSAVLDANQAVRNAQFRVVVAMDSHRHGYALSYGVDRRRHFVGQPAAVGLAEADDVGPGIGRDAATLEREFRIVTETVKEVLCIEYDGVNVSLQEYNAVVDHFDVLRPGDSQIVAHMQLP